MRLAGQLLVHTSDNAAQEDRGVALFLKYISSQSDPRRSGTLHNAYSEALHRSIMEVLPKNWLVNTTNYKATVLPHTLIEWPKGRISDFIGRPHVFDSEVLEGKIYSVIVREEPGTVDRDGALLFMLSPIGINGDFRILVDATGVSKPEEVVPALQPIIEKIPGAHMAFVTRSAPYDPRILAQSPYDPLLTSRGHSRAADLKAESVSGSASPSAPSADDLTVARRLMSLGEFAQGDHDVNEMNYAHVRYAIQQDWTNRGNPGDPISLFYAPDGKAIMTGDHFLTMSPGELLERFPELSKHPLVLVPFKVPPPLQWKDL